MNHLLKKLIEDASSIAGNDHRLSKMINVPQVSIIQWKNGTRPCPPEEVASIAYVAGYEPIEWYVRATLWKFAGTPKGDKLAKVLGKALPRTGEANDLSLRDDKVAASSTSSSTRIREKIRERINTMYRMLTREAPKGAFLLGVAL